MSQLNHFDFDREDPQPQWGRRFRMAAVFVLVAAVSAGIIYLLLPEDFGKKTEQIHSGEKVSGSTVPNATATGENTSGTENSNISGGQTAATPKAGASPLRPEEEYPAPHIDGAAATGEAAGDALSQKQDPENPTTGTTPQEAAAKAAAAAEAALEKTRESAAAKGATLVPEKDKPWIGDPVKDEPASKPELAPDQARAKLEELKALEKSGDTISLVMAIQTAMINREFTEFSEPWREAAAMLTRANLRLIEPPVRAAGLVEYTAVAGDSFGKLALRNHTTIELLKSLNGIAPETNHLRLGKRLLLLPGPWNIRISKSARVLILCNRGVPFAVFDIGVGRMNLTPSARFVISDRLRKPDWYTPDGRLIKYGDPANVLGPVFLKLAYVSAPDRPIRGLGIHGTSDESSITKSLSAGCIRMRNAEVEKLYMLVPGGTPVEIEN